MGKMLNVIGWKGMDWLDLAQDRSNFRVSLNAVMNNKSSFQFKW